MIINCLSVLHAIDCVHVRGLIILVTNVKCSASSNNIFTIVFFSKSRKLTMLAVIWDSKNNSAKKVTSS